MAEFVWEARARTGELRKGSMDADDEEAVNNRLRSQQLTPTKVKKKAKAFSISFGSGVSGKDLVTFTRLFATMIDAGLPIVQCLEILQGQTDNVHFQTVLKDVKSSVEQGATFSDSLRKHPKVFDPLYTNLVQAGEVGGILDTIMNRLAVYNEKNMKLKRQVKGAMIYPSSVVVIFTGVLCILLGFVIPSFKNIFRDLGSPDDLPVITQYVITVSEAFTHNFLVVFSSGCVAFYLFLRYYRTPNGKRRVHKILLNIPVMGPVMRKIAVARFTRTCGTLLSSGVPILDALEIVAKTAGNMVVEEAIMYARLKISEGKNMAGPLMETNVFPPMVVQMVGVGEQTGALDAMLSKIADFYEDEVDVAVAGMTSLIEPIMMVVIGGTVGVVLIAMYLPIFAMAGKIKAGQPSMELGAASVRPEAGGDRALTGRLAAITGARLLFITLLLGATAFFYLRGELAIYPLSLRITFGTIAAAYALGAVYALLLRAGASPAPLAYAQIVLDQVTWTAIVYVTGGPTSGATSFYALTCLVGAILIGLRGAAVGALTGVTAYTALWFAFAFHWISPPRDQPAAYVGEISELVYPLLVNTLGIGVVALLAGYLAERLRLTGGALEAANRRALQAERLALLGSVAAGLAHEIRNPLGSISGSIEILRESPHLSEEDKQLCAIVQREAARLNHLVTDMLDLSKPRPLHVEPVDVVALAREVVALAARTERSGSGDVNVIYEGPSDATFARCDGEQMRQVLWNLVRNAVQASGPGTQVRVVVRTDPNGVDLAVQDHGPGIAEAAREKIFDAFFTTRAGGAGMGLAVVKRIIDEHAPLGASINVESSEQGGATFRVRLASAG